MKKNNCNILAFYLHIPVCIESIRTLAFLFFNINPSIFDTLNKIIFLSFVIVYFFKIIKDNKNIGLMFSIGLFWIVFLLIGYINNNDMIYILDKSLFYFLTQVFIVFYMFQQIEKFADLEKALIPYIYMSLIYTSIFCILALSVKTNYSMSYSYNTAIASLLALNISFFRKKRKYFTFFLIFLIANLWSGSRGILLCYFFDFLFLYLISFKSRNALSSLFGGGFLSIMFSIIVFNIRSISSVLLSFLGDSRTLKLLSEGDIWNFSGRLDYYFFCLKRILESPFYIRGIYTDRLYLAEYFNRTDSNSIWGSYAHNFIIELIFQFGFWGLLILLIGFICFLKTFFLVKKYDNIQLKSIYVAITAYMMGQLIFSGSYLSVPSFGAFLGIMVIILRKANSKPGIEQ